MVTEPFERLQKLRKRAGYKNAGDAAKAFGWNVNTYRSQENGTRGINAEWADRFARAYKSSASHILYGDEAPGRAVQPANDESTLKFPELDVRAGAGAGMIVENDGHEKLGEWTMPAISVESFMRNPSTVKIIQVIGDSMLPDFLPGQRIFVDVSDRMPSPPGVFVVWDGFGLVIKRCQMIPHSEPPRVRLMSSNPAYPSYELSLDEAHVNGRVVGKLQWT